MIGLAHFRRYVATTGADPQIALQEIVLTYVLAALYQQRFGERLAFKGGTALRKLLFGPAGRFSVDLDFLGDAVTDDEVMEIATVLDELDFHGLRCHVTESRFTTSDPDEFGALTPDGFSATVEFECDLGSGSFEVDISRRRASLVPLVHRDLAEESYHGQLEFPLPRPLSLALEESAAEKISALARRMQHRNAKDVYDLYLYLPRPHDRRLLGRLTTLTLWLDRRSIHPTGQFTSRIVSVSFDWEPLGDVLPRQTIDREQVCSVVKRELERLFNETTADEQALLADATHHREVGRFTTLRNQLDGSMNRLVAPVRSPRRDFATPADR